MGTETLHDKRLQDLAERDHTSVYKYTHRVAETVLQPLDQIERFRKTINGFDAGCVEFPNATNEHLRELIMRRDPTIRQFATLCPRTFAKSTVRVFTPRQEVDLDKLRKAVMLGLVEKAYGTGTSAEKDARVAATVMRLAMREATAQELKSNAKVDLAAAMTQATAAAAAAGDPKAKAATTKPVLTPLDRMQLGEGQVKQGQTWSVADSVPAPAPPPLARPNKTQPAHAATTTKPTH